jgi:uncharacterized protein (DUF952 family)
MAIVFHIAHRSEWEAAELAGDGYAPAPFAEEGFIHCSTRDQVLNSAERHFSGTPTLVLVALDEQPLGEHLRYEPAPTVGQDFPHLYRRIGAADVVAVAPLDRAGGTAYTFPASLADLERD